MEKESEGFDYLAPKQKIRSKKDKKLFKLILKGLRKELEQQKENLRTRAWFKFRKIKQELKQ